MEHRLQTHTKQCRAQEVRLFNAFSLTDVPSSGTKGDAVAAAGKDRVPNINMFAGRRAFRNRSSV